MENEILAFYPFRLFQEGGRKYVFSGENSSIFEIDDHVHQIIRQEGKKRSDAYLGVSAQMSKREFDNLIAKMERYRFIRTSENDEAIRGLRHRKTESGLNSIILFLIQRCNLHCTYCFASEGEYQDNGIMELETAKRAVEFLAKHSTTDTPAISFFGGEPLLNFPLIERLMTHIREVERNYHKQFSLGITTNGTLLDAKQKAFLLENNIACMVSMDGDQRVQDANRRFKDGSGSYQLVADKTKDLRAKGQATCRATVTRHSLDVAASFRHLTGMGFGKVFFDAAKNMMTDEEYEEYSRQFVKFIGELKHMIEAGEYETAKKSSNLMNLLYFVHNAGLRKSCCGVGQSVAAIDIHGDIYPCQRFVCEKEYRMGSVFDSGLNQAVCSGFLDSVNIENHEQCQGCWAKNLCMGDCAYENLQMTGSVQQTDENVCQHRKDSYEAVIQLYLGLPEDFKQSLNSQ